MFFYQKESPPGLSYDVDCESMWPLGRELELPAAKKVEKSKLSGPAAQNLINEPRLEVLRPRLNGQERPVDQGTASRLPSNVSLAPGVAASQRRSA